MKRAFRHFVGGLMECVHFPAVVKPFELEYPVAGHTVKLETSERYAILSIGPRDYFFYIVVENSGDREAPIIHPTHAR